MKKKKRTRVKPKSPYGISSLLKRRTSNIIIKTETTTTQNMDMNRVYHSISESRQRMTLMKWLYRGFIFQGRQHLYSWYEEIK